MVDRNEQAQAHQRQRDECAANQISHGTLRHLQTQPTVLFLSSFLSVGTFLHGSQPHPASHPPGVW